MKKKLKKIIKRYKITCLNAYQVIGALGLLHESTIPIMDNLVAAVDERPLPHKKILPFFAPTYEEIHQGDE